MKKCYTCGEVKDKSSFNKNKSRKDGLNSICRDCSKARSKQYYAENREKHLVEVRKSKERGLERARNLIFEHLQANPCVDCGESDPIVLEFDHVRGKTRNISDMLQNNCGVKTIAKEIEKCDVRCANCHRRKTAIDFDWWIAKR
jgi:hypothetical protein